MIGVAAVGPCVSHASLIVAYLHPRPRPEPVAEVAKRGESGLPEFKSSDARRQAR